MKTMRAKPFLGWGLLALIAIVAATGSVLIASAQEQAAPTTISAEGGIDPDEVVVSP
jgi:hypothetical protein